MATELAKAYVQIVPSAQGIKGNIEKELGGELGSVGKSAGESIGADLGKQLIGTLKTVLAAAGIGKIIKDALSAGGAIQQSFGGLETIYGEAAEGAKKYAYEAAKAGISANEYAEQAVSFGASLKQAFGGDTEQAMEAANTAILDMTDNAAKMGTPIESIQNAYQGFAKQNYTMLDNLKLGYGGTKTEMERLLKDAEKLSGVKYDISNLGDVYNAIHVIQEDLGLTGVAAAEAEGTFTGSMGAMRAAMQNFLGQLATGGDVKESLQIMITSIATFLGNNMVPMLGNIISAIPTVITTATPMMIEAAGDLLSNLQGMLTGEGGPMAAIGLNMSTDMVTGFLSNSAAVIESAGTTVAQFASAALEAAPSVISSASETINEYTAAILQGLPGVLDAATAVVTELSNGMLGNLPQVISAAGEAITSFLQTVIDNLPAVIESGVKLITAITKGIYDNRVAIVTAIADVIRNIVSTIVSNLPQILEMGITLLASLASGIIRAIPQVLIAIGTLIAEITKSFFTTDWAQIGSDILSGIANGLRNGLSIIADAAKDAASSAFNAAKNFLGIESPSKLFRDEVGAMMAEGMALGFKDNVPTAELEAALQPMGSVVPDALGSQYSYGGFTINVYGSPGQDEQTLADIVSDRINQAIMARQAVFA